jgi:hypothetical protein
LRKATSITNKYTKRKNKITLSSILHMWGTQGNDMQ